MLVTAKIAKSMAIATDRHNDRLTEENPLFDRVITRLSEAETLPVGQKLIVSSGNLRDKPTTIYLINDHGFVKLFVKVNGWTAPPIHLGSWTSHGKEITTDLAEFNTWHNRTRARIGKMESRNEL